MGSVTLGPTASTLSRGSSLLFQMRPLPRPSWSPKPASGTFCMDDGAFASELQLLPSLQPSSAFQQGIFTSDGLQELLSFFLHISEFCIEKVHHKGHLECVPYGALSRCRTH